MSRYDLTEADLAGLLPGEPPYRARQIFSGMHAALRSPEELTELPLPLRAALCEMPELEAAFEVVEEVSCDGGSTRRFLLGARRDASEVETVLMSYRRRTTACVSSQVGCAMGCSFCATGQLGYGRQLSLGEIVEQIVRSARACSELGWGRLDNVVFMGMGEPLANYGAVLGAIDRCRAALSMGARSFTVSTVGIVPGIRRLSAEPVQVNLAVSLHAANDELRSSIVPINRRYPIEELMAACRAYAGRTRRRISFEWALISGLNDRPDDAAELAALVAPLRQLAHVNLIPLNPTPGYPALGSPPAVVGSFRDRLTALGVNVTVRATRGREIAAACGQLAGRQRVSGLRPGPVRAGAGVRPVPRLASRR